MAQLQVELLGLRFPNPILCGAGPHSDGPANLAAAARGGAGGLIAQTVLAQPFLAPPDPTWVTYGRDGILTCQRGAQRSPNEWCFPSDVDVPVIASLAGTAADVGALGARLVAQGAQALEYATAFEPHWPDAVAALEALRQAVSVPIIAKLNLRHGEDIADRAAEVERYVDAFTCMGGFGPVLDIDVDGGGAPRLSDPYGYGWLSGGPVHPIAVRTVFEVARRVQKPVIACGGAMAVRDVVEFLEVGASLVEVTTLPILKGPSVYRSLASELDTWLDEHHYAAVADLRGVYLQRFGHGQRVVLTAEEAPVLDQSKCSGCAICGQVCYFDAIHAKPKEYPAINPANCFECGLCVSACPDGALAFRPREQVTMLPPREVQR